MAYGFVVDSMLRKWNLMRTICFFKGNAVFKLRCSVALNFPGFNSKFCSPLPAWTPSKFVLLFILWKCSFLQHLHKKTSICEGELVKLLRRDCVLAHQRSSSLSIWYYNAGKKHVTFTTFFSFHILQRLVADVKENYTHTSFYSGKAKHKLRVASSDIQVVS